MLKSFYCICCYRFCFSTTASKKNLFTFFFVPIRLLNCYECPSDEFYNSILFILTMNAGLFKMVTFVDKTTNGRRYLHIQPSGNDVDGEETKLPIRNPITSLCKSDCARGLPSLPWWSTENLKTGKTFLLSSHIKMKRNLTSYQLLRHDIESERKSWAKLPLHGEFSYKPLYWEWLEDILVRCKDKLTTLTTKNVAFLHI